MARLWQHLWPASSPVSGCASSRTGERGISQMWQELNQSFLLSSTKISSKSCQTRTNNPIRYRSRRIISTCTSTVCACLFARLQARHPQEAGTQPRRANIYKNLWFCMSWIVLSCLHILGFHALLPSILSGRLMHFYPVACNVCLILSRVLYVTSNLCRSDVDTGIQESHVTHSQPVMGHSFSSAVVVQNKRSKSDEHIY